MLLVTFHETIGNIYGFDETKPGSQPIENLLEIPGSQLSELRGMLLANGFLYVVNGGKGVSNVLCCAPDPDNAYRYTLRSVFVSDALAAVDHPFDVAFWIVTTPALPLQTEPQIWYVSDQDSNVVASLSSQAPYDSTTPSDTSGYLGALLTALQNAKSKLAEPGFLPATFVPTAVVGAEIPNQTTVDPSWGGLTPSFSTDDSSLKKKKEKVQNSVRGVVVSNGVLYVADEAGNAVRMYDPVTGVPWGSTTVKGPVHLLVQDGTLYVPSGDSVLHGPCVSAPANPPALPAPNRFSGPAAPPPPYPAPPSGYVNSVTLTLSDLGLNLPKGSGPSGLAFDVSGTSTSRSAKRRGFTSTCRIRR